MKSYDAYRKKRFDNLPDPEDKAEGGRIGLKTGMARRAFFW